MLLAGFLAGLALAVAADDIITKPSPGNEYVSLAVGGHVGRKSHHNMKVYVNDEGTTGYKRSDKPHTAKKGESLASGKKATPTLKAAVKDEGAVGVEKKESSGIGVPPLKHISFPTHSEKKSHVEKREDSPDFDDDTPIIPAASSQTSRINVKKGPNGQEYEYEYVYYYYDDEDETTDGKKGAKGDAAGSTARPKPVVETEKPDTPPEPRQEVRQDLQDLRQEQPARHHQDRSEARTQDLRQDERHTLRDEPPRHRTGTEQRYQLERDEEVPASRQRGGDRYEEVGSRGRQTQESGGRGRTEPRQEETRRGRPTAAAPEDTASRNRYTTIERGRGKPSDLAATTAEPSSNEVLPTRSSTRNRGQHVDVVDEERIQPTRFPSRARGSLTAEPSRAPEQPQQPTSRSRGQERGGGAVRRPSLVDSSSFRTHNGADHPVPQDEEKPGYLSSQYLNTRESDYEEYVRPTTFLPPPVVATTLLPAPAVQQPQVTESDEMPQKAALDLYAILQQTQEENSVLDLDVKTTDIPSTEPPTTTPEPTTTTTTTTTTTPPPPPVTQRGRFRTGSRQRLRAQSTSTTTEAAAEEEPPKREKFKPSHNRNPGHVSAYGRRRAGGSTTAAPTTEAAQHSTRARPNSFGASNNGNRFRTRGRLSTTQSPQEEEPSEEPEPSSTTARPARARISGTPGARPLRPGPRLNLRPRPGVPSSTPAAELPQDEPVATTQSEPAPVTPQPHAEGDSLTKLRSRPRLKVQQPSVQPRPFSAANRRPLPGLRRRTTEAESEAEATTPTIQIAETEPPAAPSSSEPPQPQPTESKLSSLIARRRPIARRIQHQPPAEK